MTDEELAAIEMRLRGPHDCHTIIRDDAPRLLAEVRELRLKMSKRPRGPIVYVENFTADANAMRELRAILSRLEVYPDEPA